MDRIMRQMRVFAFVMLALILAVAFAVVGPQATDAQDDDEAEPCELDDEELGPCIEDMEHVYEDQCEGIDCYSALEICCLEEIVVIVQ